MSFNSGKHQVLLIVFTLILVCIVIQPIIVIYASFRSSITNAKTPKYISQFYVYQEGDFLKLRFSLQDEDLASTSADGTVNLKIYDNRDYLVYDKTHQIERRNFEDYVIVFTGAKIVAYTWDIPFSSIKKGVGIGKAFLTFTSKGKIWETTFDYVPIPEYTEEELAELYEAQYLASRTIINKTIIKTPFEITLISIGKYTYAPYIWSDEDAFFRIDLKVRNIGKEKDYLWEYNIVIIDNLWNQYDYEYGGTLELGELYPGVIRTGSVLFTLLNKDADSIRIIITKSEYPEDIVYEFKLGVSEILRDPSTISCSISPNIVTQGEYIIVTGSINPSVSGVAVTLTYSKPDGSTFTRTVTTSSDGAYSDSYTLAEIGSWSVNASWKGDSTYNGATSKTVEFTVVEQPPTGSLKIIVQDENRNPIIGATVYSTSQPSDQQPFSGTSGADGSVTFVDVLIGDYTIRARKSGYDTIYESVTVIEDETTTLEIQLKEQFGTLNIYVKDKEGNPVIGAAITSTSQPSRQSALSGTSISDGSVTFSGVKLGLYTFQASKSGYITGTRSVSATAGKSRLLTIILEKEATGVEGIPGFPYESIILGLVAGVFILWMLQRRR